MVRRGWITLATVAFITAGAVAGTAAVAADLRLETSPARVLPGGAVTGKMASFVDPPGTGDDGLGSTGGADTSTASPVDGAGTPVDSVPPAAVVPPVAVVPPAPVLPPAGDDSDDDDSYDDDGGDGDDDAGDGDD